MAQRPKSRKPPRSQPWRLQHAAPLLGLVFAVILLKNAWLSDDAYITFRTVENLVAGDGAVFNAGERVQSYTHPLWMFSLAALRIFTQELYFTSIFFSVAITLFLLLLLSKLTPKHAGIAIFSLLASKAFMDYSTSGLENPLSHLLLALFVFFTFRQRNDSRSLLTATLIASLAALTRLDTLVLYMPILWVLYRAAGWRSTAGRLIVGFSPLVLWTLFSLLYYGAPVANPAYAKLATGISRFDLMRQGMHYYVDSLTVDPATLLVIVAGCVVGFLNKDIRHRALALGISLYLIYIVSIGGDFMSGRFFSTPLLGGTILVALNAARFSLQKRAVACACLVLLGLVSAKAHWFSGSGYGDVPLVQTRHFGQLPLSLINKHGISDERAFYFQATGLFRPGSGSIPDHQWVRQGMETARGGPSTQVFYTLGFTGYYSGSDVHIIDPNGLNDFLIARLPIPRNTKWRIGHYTRQLPEGYLESVQSKENQIVNDGLAEYYDMVRLVIAGDLFVPSRLAAIWKLNVGGYNHLIRSYSRRQSTSLRDPS